MRSKSVQLRKKGNLKMKYCLIAAFLLVSACQTSPTDERGTFAYVGCHTVTQNPAPDGEHAFFIFIDLVEGDELYFKQINNENGIPTPVSSGIKCN